MSREPSFLKRIRIQNNTDAVDIRDKCLGLDIWIEGDSVNLLNTNRGLHTQVRHNGVKEVFEAAVKVSRLMAAAPEMLEVLERVILFDENHRDKHGNKIGISHKNCACDICSVIKKARGES